MRIVITGGAGFIGSEMVRQLTALDHEIIVIDSLTYAGNEETLVDVRDEIVFHKIDIRDQNQLDDFFNNLEVDAVVNFAAETHVDNSIRTPGIFLETNILGTFNLLEAAKNHKFRFLQVSTDEVYGSIRKGFFSEIDKLDPSSPYSASKAAAELMLQAYVKTYSIEALGVRCSNNYGHYQHFEKLIPAFIARMLQGKKLPIYGSGMNIREWIHVSDSVSGIITVLLQGKVGDFYNISSNEFRSNLEVATSIIDYFGGGPESIEHVPDRLGHDFRYAITSEKIRTELGWNPTVEFKNGLSVTIDWYVANREYLGEN